MRTRAADDFDTIRARIIELKTEAEPRCPVIPSRRLIGSEGRKSRRIERKFKAVWVRRIPYRCGPAHNSTASPPSGRNLPIEAAAAYSSRQV
jgi:hypothetical protein